jgi:hypothetical protein
VDFAFTGQRSKDKTRGETYTGINGKTCYILLADHATTVLDGAPRISKGAPLVWLHNWLLRHSPGISNQYVYLDQGGELFQNPKVRALFAKFGYEVRATGADSSHQNGPVERAHQTIGNALRTMLTGAGLDSRFWPYAFHNHLRIKNALPGKDNAPSPFERCHASKPNFRDFRTFGCCVWVRPPGKRSGKLRNHARKGVFLGFLPNTLKNILWYDVETKRVKIAFHARFDEGMNDLPHVDIPPNVQHLQRIQNGEPLPSESAPVSVSPFGFSSRPFLNETDVTIRIQCTSDTFGFTLSTDQLTNRVFISDLAPQSSAETLCRTARATRKKYLGAFITAIQDIPVFTLTNAKRKFRRLRVLTPSPDKISLSLAPKPLPSSRHRTAAQKELDLLDPHHLTSNDSDDELRITPATLRAIHALHTDSPVDCNDISDDKIELLLSALQSEAITDAERALGSFTRRKLKTLDTWPQWRAGETTQLDQFHELGMFGSPCFAPSDAVVLSSHWQYRIKTSGKRRSRNCCDGSPRAAPKLHAMADTYASCVEQPVSCLFFALSVAMNYLLYGGDAQDAFAHSPVLILPARLSSQACHSHEFSHDMQDRTLDTQLITHSVTNRCSLVIT